MNGMLAGAIGGLGSGLSQLGERARQDNVRAEEEKIQIERERRIEEAAMRSELRREVSDVRKEVRLEDAQIREEQRGLANKELERQSEFKFQTDPNNVGMLGRAKVQGQRVVDEYSDSRADIEAAQAADKAGRIHKATDNTDYEGRKYNIEGQKLENEARRKAIDAGYFGTGKSGGMIGDLTKSQEKQADFLKEKYKSLASERDNAQTPEQRHDAQDEMDKVEQQIYKLLNGNSLGNDAQHEESPLGQSVRKAYLMEQIKKVDPKAVLNLDDAVTVEELQFILD